MNLVWVTTLDNMFNPFTEFDEWKQRDEELGYYTCETLDRIHGSTIELSNELNNILLEQTIDRMLREFSFINYVKVHEDDEILFEIIKNKNTNIT
jgi:hypothetical protein